MRERTAFASSRVRYDIGEAELLYLVDSDQLAREVLQDCAGGTGKGPGQGQEQARPPELTSKIRSPISMPKRP